MSKTTLSGHLCADLIRIVALSMIADRSRELSWGSGTPQPAINRRTASALPTTTKYLAMGTANSARDLSNLGQPVTATIDHADAARQIDNRLALAIDEAVAKVVKPLPKQRQRSR
ncbi:hypothetical protein QA640_47775 (plasmid) [Bradyrhizobium sp. CB82]|uniref:hypothetical protein n=1 Tax=Bradyrhizobium sp. CB82 TaxID=3039159 RepID=UPI0024B20DB4|nr:hypothetical protein [Bradyrhizobium sp. CB82]WFU45684.1 hypothetical protein QA640_47775 [Bradyrhizobium sp. CB82]